MDRSELQTLIETIQDGVPNTAETVRGVLTAIADGISGTIKIIEVATSYITANFDPTGLGTNLELGYAICNGNNGTRDWRGRVPMQYSTTYPTLGATGGEATHVLTDNEIPPVSVPYTGSNADNGDTGTLIITAATQSNGAKNLTTAGGGQAHNNMQPYIVTLILMKL